VQEEKFNETLDMYLSAKNVGPEARNKLKGLLKYYAKKPHPFRACVTPDTPVDMPRDMEIHPDGVPISQLRTGDLVWSFNKNERVFELKPVLWAEVTRKNSILIEVALDNDKKIRCTPDHRFMLRNGEWVEAKNLRSGDSLMPLYRDFTPRVRLRPDKLGYEDEHKAIGRSLGHVKGKHVHHIDERRANTSTDNIAIVTGSEHISSHHAQFSDVVSSKNEQWCCLDCNGLYVPNRRNQKRCNDCQLAKETYVKTTVGTEKQCNLCESSFIVVQPNQKFCSSSCRKSFHDQKSKDSRRKRSQHRMLLGLPARKVIGERICVGCGVEFSMRANNQKYCDVECRELATKNPLTPDCSIWNHKVISVKNISETSDVWDIEVQDNHNFVVNGVVLHNCVKDNRKRFGPRTEAVCATLKDIIRGGTDWRGNKSKDKGSEGIANLSYPDTVSADYSNMPVNTDPNNGDEQKLLTEIVSNIAEGIKYFKENTEKNSDIPLHDYLLANDVRIMQSIESLKAFAVSMAKYHQENDLNEEWDNQDPNGVDYYEFLLYGGYEGKEYVDKYLEQDQQAIVDMGLSELLDNLTEDQLENLMLLAQEEIYEEEKAELEGSVQLSELYLPSSDSTTEIESDKKDSKVWKTVLKTGTWSLSPGASGVSNQAMIVTRGKGLTDGNKKVISLDDVVDSFTDKAVQYVTVPLEHTSSPDKNTGYIKDLKIVECDGESHLKALIDFTEQDIKQKVVNGSIADTSVGLKFGYRRKRDGATYKVALDHVALTNKPWIDGLPSFGLSEEGVSEFPLFVYKENESEKSDMDNVEDVKLSDNSAEREAVARAESVEKINAELASKVREYEVKEKIAELSESGLSEYPAFLTKVKEIMLADTGHTILELSDDGKSTALTATGVIEQLIDVLPKESKLDLSSQGLDTGSKKPEEDTSKEITQEQKTAAVAEFLYPGKA